VGGHDEATPIRGQPGIPERVLLFCVASDTEWERAGITGATVTAMIVRGLIERDAGEPARSPDEGRAAVAALIG
jgi:hypothetical protein